MNPQQKLIKLALTEAERHQTPFGAVLAMGDEPVVTAVNTTSVDHDPTAHAELNAMRELGKLTRKNRFPGYTLYSTIEPCPMCASAMVWANIRTLVFGASIADIKAFIPQITIPCRQIFAQSDMDVEITSGVLGGECLQLVKKYC